MPKDQITKDYFAHYPKGHIEKEARLSAFSSSYLTLHGHIQNQFHNMRKFSGSIGLGVTVYGYVGQSDCTALSLHCKLN